MRIAALAPLLLTLTACGGTVVTDGGGGAGGASTQSSTPGDTSAPSSSSGDPVGSVVSSGVTSSVVASSSTGPDPIACDGHDDCGTSIGDDVCVFSSGFCAQRCGSGSPPCPPGTQCVDCATGSCPGCEDCVSACLAP